ncbi:NAD(P)/FAD-dependent oxidoreductase [Colwellia sp. 12G3]|uniref:NAD(P)/FAD-dependent oxidoreductase n=1 Tax=Colwellia sp. 12G3 TaxID=2058299 RepID=UPI000C32EB01|nr:NAD(P)/FAD-dependent oxidoreductase [Colwellia sp. 12G3]PKI13867.1 FAD-dependent oxidoreductase [Colwellia sp. 12G3]
MSKANMFDITIIGAGPSGAIAASLLMQKGWSVCILEREHFPRFSIGESLLPHCMEMIEQANMLDALLANAEKLGFQFKNGAAFHRDGDDCHFDFTKKFTQGTGTTFQVKRADFDKLLADEAQKQGAEIRYGHSVTAFESTKKGTSLSVKGPEGDYQINAQFTLDASGFGRVLPRLLKLEKDSVLTNRKAIFTHFKDNIAQTSIGENFDRNKILITVHPTKADVWYWLIPFSDGTASIGVVGEDHYFNDTKQTDLTSEQLAVTLLQYINEDANLAKLLAKAEIIAPVRTIGGYSANVSSLHGENFALLGNAGEFLDPVFSSGVTIAMHSAMLAAEVVDQQLSNKTVDWDNDYSLPLSKGIETFKHFVMSWYDTSLQDVIFFSDEDTDIKPMICSILAGYAWDEKNPYVSNTKRRLNVLAEICQDEQTTVVAK